MTTDKVPPLAHPDPLPPYTSLYHEEVPHNIVLMLTFPAWHDCYLWGANGRQEHWNKLRIYIDPPVPSFFTVCGI